MWGISRPGKCRNGPIVNVCCLLTGWLGRISIRVPPGLSSACSQTGQIERLRPCEAALSEHLERRLDALRVVQATQRYEDRPRKALQLTGEDPRAAIGAEVPIQPLTRWRSSRFRRHRSLFCGRYPLRANHLRG